MEDANSLRAGYSSKRLSFALCIGGLCILAVLLEAPDAANNQVEESLKQNNDMQPLPESVDDFMLTAVKQGSSLSPWHTFNLARKKAKAMVRPDDPTLKKLEKKCGDVRTSAFLQCGKSFCTAKLACGTPCRHSKELEVVPLTSGYGPKFFNMREGTDKAAMKKKQMVARMVARKLKKAAEVKREKGTKAADAEKVRQEKGVKHKQQEKGVKHKQKQAEAHVKARESALEQAKKAHKKVLLKREKKNKHAIALKASKKVLRKILKTKKFVKKKALVSHAEKAASKATRGVVQKHVHELSTKATAQARIVAKSRQHQHHQAKALAKKKAALARAAKAKKGSVKDIAADKHAKELKQKVATQAKKLSSSRKQRKKHAKNLARKTNALRKVLSAEKKSGIVAKKHLKHAKELSSKVRRHAKKASAARKHSQKQSKVLAHKKKLLAAARQLAQKCQQFWTKKQGKCVQTCPLKTQKRAASGRCKCNLGGSNQLCYVGSVCKKNLCEDAHPKTVAAKKKTRQHLTKELSHKVAVAAKVSVAASKHSKAQASALAKKKASLAHTAKMASASAKGFAQKRVHELTAKVSKQAKQLSTARMRSQQLARALAKKKALAMRAAKAAAAKANHQKSVQVHELSKKVSQQAKQLAADRKRSKRQAKALAAAVAAPKKALAASKKMVHRAALKAVEEVKSHTGIYGIALKAAKAAAAATLKAKTHTDWAGAKVRPSKGELLKQALKAASITTKTVIKQGIKTLARKEAALAYKLAIKQKHTKAYAKKLSKKVLQASQAKGIAAGLRILHRAVKNAVKMVMGSTAANAKTSMERHHKLGPAISEARSMKSNSLLKCNKRGQQVYMKCEDRRLARIKIKAKESAFKVRTDKKKSIVLAHQNVTQNSTQNVHHHKVVAKNAAAALVNRANKDSAAVHAYASAQAVRRMSKLVAKKIRLKHQMIAKKLGPKTAKVLKAVQIRPSLLKKGKNAMSHHDHKKFIRRAKRALKIARQVHNGAYASAFMNKPSTQAELKMAANYAKSAMQPTLLMQQALATAPVVGKESQVAKAALKRDQNAVYTDKMKVKYEQARAKKAHKDVQAGEKYTQSHRGFLHRKTCANEMRYAFDLCFGRMRWKNEVVHTKKGAKDTKKLAKAQRQRTAAIKILQKVEKKEMQATRAAAGAAAATATTTPKFVTKKSIPKAAAPKAAPKTAQLSLVQSDAILKQRPTQKERMCYRAKMTAYGQCRATVNAAYMECAHWYGKLKPSKGYKKKGK